jgi:hypothetical protein
VAGIAASYRIGPSDFFTSDDLAADAETLKGQIAVLDGLNWDGVSQALFDSWLQYLSDFNRFYSGTFVSNWFGAGWNNSNRDELIQLERRYLDFLSRWEKESGEPAPGGVVNPSTGTKDSFADHLKDQLPETGDLLIWVGVLVAIVVVINLLD